MRRALELAGKGVGCTRPNPVVGCVILDAEGEVVGEGFHPRAGEPHAEVWALRQAGEKARGGTAYVTLEPCNHYGRTPPCTEALLKSGVARVVAGMVDPDPRVAGGGLQRLAEAGVQVMVGVEEERCRAINAPFVHCIAHGSSYGVLRALVSREGSLHLGLSASPWPGTDGLIVEGRQGMKLLEEAVAGPWPPGVYRVVLLPSLDGEDDLVASLSGPFWKSSANSTIIIAGDTPAGDLAHKNILEEHGIKVHISALKPVHIAKILRQAGLLSVQWATGADMAADAVRQKHVQLAIFQSAPGGDTESNLNECRTHICASGNEQQVGSIHPPSSSERLFKALKEEARVVSAIDGRDHFNVTMGKPATTSPL